MLTALSVPLPVVAALLSFATVASVLFKFGALTLAGVCVADMDR